MGGGAMPIGGGAICGGMPICGGGTPIGGIPCWRAPMGGAYMTSLLVAAFRAVNCGCAHRLGLAGFLASRVPAAKL